MNRTLLVVALLGLGGVVGCQGSMPDPLSNQALAQVEFDLTVTDDRAKFREDGLQFQGSVGPYAVYKVTSANPQLIGPYIRVTKDVGFAMLCGAKNYFAASRLTAQSVIALKGGRSGNIQLVASMQDPATDGDCASPTDVFGKPLPDGGVPAGSGDPTGGGGTTTGGDPTGGGTTGGDPTGGGTTGTGGTGTGTTGGGTTGGTDPTGGGTTGGTDPTGTGGGTTGSGGTAGGTGDGCIEGCGGLGGTGATAGSGTSGTGITDDPMIQRLNVSFNKAPLIGATVLLRRVALTGARIHNDSHIIPAICCRAGQCSLKSVR